MSQGWKTRIEPGDAEIVLTLVPDPAPQDRFIEIRIAAERDAEGDGSAAIKLDKARAIQGPVQGPPAHPRHRQPPPQRVRHGLRRHFHAEQREPAGVPVRDGLRRDAESRQSRPFYAVTNRLQHYNNANKVLQDFFNGLRFTSQIVLAQGDPPLTQYKADETIDFLEWLLEVPFTQGQKQAVQDFLLKASRDRDEKEMTGVADILQGKVELAKMNEQQRTLALEVMRKEAMKMSRRARATRCRN